MEIENTLEYLSPLESLPIEIVYKVFDVTPFELFIKLRSVSHTLKLYVDGYAMLPENQPTGASLEISGPEKLSSSTIICTLFGINVSGIDKEKFKLRIGCKPPIGIIEGNTRIRKAKIQHGLKDYVLYIDILRDNPNILVYLAECLGTSIHGIYLRGDAGSFVSTLFDNKQIAMLAVFRQQLSDEEVNQHLHICSSNSVQHLTLNVTEFADNQPGAVLLNFASYVSSLTINHSNQWSVSKDPRDIQCLFNVPGIDWAPIILDMFGRKIEITKDWKHGYLSRDSADLLIEKLPLLKKKFFFETSCRHYDVGLNYAKNGCTIRVDSEPNMAEPYRRLTISNIDHGSSA